VLARHVVTASDSVKFNLQILKTFRRKRRPPLAVAAAGTAGQSGGGETLTVVVPLADFRCRCPKLRVRKTYLVAVGPTSESQLTSQSNAVGGGGGAGRRRETYVGDAAVPDSAKSGAMVVDSNSVVLRWNDQVARRVNELVSANGGSSLGRASTGMGGSRTSACF
jgi:hypothetical protein